MGRGHAGLYQPPPPRVHALDPLRPRRHVQSTFNAPPSGGGAEAWLGVTRTARLFLIAGLSTLVAAAPPAFDRSVARVRARPGQGSLATGIGGRAARTRCIGVDHVAGAVVFGDRAVELTMTDHTRWRMNFADACPALGFYQGFYYRRALAGRLCAGRDAVISRAGGTCPITSIVRVRP
ncbi:MAG: hypothetical protein JO290_08845 [Sphingomonadaceae bacterium]|nr:hypothetical protein [Sphingomonadaceae bacterium]